MHQARMDCLKDNRKTNGQHSLSAPLRILARGKGGGLWIFRNSVPPPGVGRHISPMSVHLIIFIHIIKRYRRVSPDEISIRYILTIPKCPIENTSTIYAQERKNSVYREHNGICLFRIDRI